MAGINLVARCCTGPNFKMWGSDNSSVFKNGPNQCTTQAEKHIITHVAKAFYY